MFNKSASSLLRLYEPVFLQYSNLIFNFFGLIFHHFRRFLRTRRIQKIRPTKLKMLPHPNEENLLLHAW